MQNTENKTKSFIKQNNLLPNGEKVLLAVSGGADSVTLLYIFDKLIPNAVHIAHINHQLRGGESLKDEEFVKSLAGKLNLPITAESVDVKSYAKKNKLSIETAARKLRLAALRQIADRNNCGIIATAHHKNDNAETVIHRLIRGTGFKGLAGIRPKTVIDGKTFIRPLLCLTRKEIEEYLKKNNTSWRNDHTNLDCRFTRNKIRHKITPYLEKIAPDIVELVCDLSQHCGVLAANIEQITKAAVRRCIIAEEKTQIVVDTDKYKKESQPVQVELIQIVLTRLGCGLRGYTFENYKKIIDFVKSAGVGKTLTVPGKIKITKGYGRFFVTAPSQKKTDVQKEIVLPVPGKTIFANWEIKTELMTADKVDIKKIANKKDNFTEWFDYENIKLPLVARQRRQGDKFRPFGLKESKKIGKFLTSQKIDFNQRKNSFIIGDSEKILWLVPIRRSYDEIVDVKSRKILQITVLENT